MSATKTNLPAHLLLGFIAVSACVTAPSPVRRDLASQPWLELRSTHFVLTTDLGRDGAERELASLEELWWALADNYSLILPKANLPAGRIPITILSSCEDFAALIWQPAIGGYVHDSLDFEGTRMVVSCVRGAVGEILLHELSHVFNYHFFNFLPPWLNEGLATYFQTLRIHDGRVVLGKQSAMDADRWSRPFHGPTFAELRALGSGDFHAPGDRRNYFAAWKLVHLLNNSSPDYHRRFQIYLERIHTGSERGVAWTSAFGDLPEGQLAEEYRTYHMRRLIPLWEASHVVHPRSPTTSRRLSPGEVNAAWARLLLIKSLAGDLPLAAPWQQLELAGGSGLHPDDLATEFWRATFEYYAPRQSAGERPLEHLRRYLARQPDDARARRCVSTSLRQVARAITEAPVRLRAVG